MSEYMNRAGAALVGAVIAVIGVFGPWASVELGVFSQSRQGINTEDGKILLVLMLVAAAGTIAARRRRGWWLLVVPGVLALAVAIYDFADISSLEGGEVFGRRVEPTVGWGLYACVIGTVVFLGACLYRASRTRSPGAVEGDPVEGDQEVEAPASVA